MGRYWWVTWIKVGVIVLLISVVLLFGYFKVKDVLSDYLADSGEDASFLEKLDIEELVFDFGNYFAEDVMEGAEEDRNAITAPLS